MCCAALIQFAAYRLQQQANASSSTTTAQPGKTGAAVTSSQSSSHSSRMPLVEVPTSKLFASSSNNGSSRQAVTASTAAKQAQNKAGTSSSTSNRPTLLAMASTSSATSSASSSSKPSSISSASSVVQGTTVLPSSTDIGKYDGGLDDDDGNVIEIDDSADLNDGDPTGKAARLNTSHMSAESAQILALDSSTSGPRRAGSDAPAPKPWKLSSFELGRALGKGKFGRVYMVRTLCEPRFIIALKCLHKMEIVQAKVEKQVRREIEIQSHLRHMMKRGYSSCSNSPGKVNYTSSCIDTVDSAKSGAVG